MCTMIKGAKQLGFPTRGLHIAGPGVKCLLFEGEVNESGPGDPTFKIL
jgi:hypothetical protein